MYEKQPNNLTLSEPEMKNAPVTFVEWTSGRLKHPQSVGDSY